MEETIAAIATAYGEGGIGIIRISGAKAGEILRDIFIPAKTSGIVANTEESYIANRRLTYGRVCEPCTGKALDEVLAVFMKAPGTYTAEDVAEIHCHGGVVSLRRILALVLKRGARLAEPGEFTKRAFLNGRLDLSQAEAVIDLIQAKTEKSFDVAMDQLAGRLSEEITGLRSRLLELMVEVAVNIDYPDEDIEEITYENLLYRISSINDEIEILIDSADTGRILREGIAISIVGKPNVGKSSLMNVLLRESRAIVTEIPGTTRDTIEEQWSLDGVKIRLTDTAGIRETGDQIEKIGIERTRAAMEKAELLLIPIDGSKPLEAEDLEILEAVGARPAIVLLNKKDLGSLVKAEDIKALLPTAKVVETSLLLEDGIDRVEAVIQDILRAGGINTGESSVITNLRQEALLRKAFSDLEAAKTLAAKGEALDFIEVDIKNAYEALGELIGESIAPDIIDQVFARFCLGK